LKRAREKKRGEGRERVGGGETRNLLKINYPDVIFSVAIVLSKSKKKSIKYIKSIHHQKDFIFYSITNIHI